MSEIKNNFFRFSVQMRTRKFASEIYWPLICIETDTWKVLHNKSLCIQFLSLLSKLLLIMLKKILTLVFTLVEPMIFPTPSTWTQGFVQQVRKGLSCGCVWLSKLGAVNPRPKKAIKATRVETMCMIKIGQINETRISEMRLRKECCSKFYNII